MSEVTPAVQAHNTGLVQTALPTPESPPRPSKCAPTPSACDAINSTLEPTSGFDEHYAMHHGQLPKWFKCNAPDDCPVANHTRRHSDLAHGNPFLGDPDANPFIEGQDLNQAQMSPEERARSMELDAAMSGRRMPGDPLDAAFEAQYATSRMSLEGHTTPRSTCSRQVPLTPHMHIRALDLAVALASNRVPESEPAQMWCGCSAAELDQLFMPEAEACSCPGSPPA